MMVMRIIICLPVSLSGCLLVSPQIMCIGGGDGDDCYPTVYSVTEILYGKLS